MTDLRRTVPGRENRAALFEPFNLGALTLPNRLAAAPMTHVGEAEAGHATAGMANHYVRFSHEASA